MTENEKIIRKLDTLERLVRDLLKDTKKVTWVKASVVKHLTGWDGERMRRARRNGDIEFKHDNGFWYNANSIPPIFLLNHKQTA